MSAPRSCECGICRKCRHRINETRRYRLKAYGQWEPHLTDATGTVRRVRALVTIGWTLNQQAQHIGLTGGALGIYTANRVPSVLVTTADKMTAIYDRLSMTSGPSTRAAAVARRKRWHRPLCWDDDQIDNPHHEPPEGCCDTHGQRPRTLPDTPTDVARMAATVNEHGARTAAWRHGTSISAVHKALTRAGWINTAGNGQPARYEPPPSPQPCGQPVDNLWITLWITPLGQPLDTPPTW